MAYQFPQNQLTIIHTLILINEEVKNGKKYKSFAETKNRI